jgi:membrane protein involved in colicin uptake
VFIFVWWERLARTATEAANQAAESANQAAESASEAAESATKKAEAASEAASQAAESATGGDPTEGDDSMASPTKLDAGKQAGAGQQAGTHRAPARRRAPDRRPNKRFQNDDSRQQRLSTDENGDEFEQVELEELPQQGGGFENAGRTDRGSTNRLPQVEDD